MEVFAIVSNTTSFKPCLVKSIKIPNLASAGVEAMFVAPSPESLGFHRIVLVNINRKHQCTNKLVKPYQPLRISVRFQLTVS